MTAKRKYRTGLRGWWDSLRRARNSQAALLRNLYGSTNWTTRETWIVAAWPRCTWKWRAAGLCAPWYETVAPRNLVKFERDKR